MGTGGTRWDSPPASHPRGPVGSGERAPSWGHGRCCRDPHLQEPARVLARAPKAPIGLQHAVGEQRGQGGPTWAILPPAAPGLLPSKGGAPGQLGPTGSPSPTARTLEAGLHNALTAAPDYTAQGGNTKTARDEHPTRTDWAVMGRLKIAPFTPGMTPELVSRDQPPRGGTWVGTGEGSLRPRPGRGVR